MRWIAIAALMTVVCPSFSQPPKATPGNRLAYLDELDPYYPHAKFPKLITPQWVGEDGVEAVVILAIDDMREPAKYETFLRPILRRLQKIDGRAPVSIMTCSINPKDPQLQTWLKEGLSIECHTIDHPCPFFKIGFEKAKSTYDRCVDLMNDIPGNKPVAFRMPCCDSLNTPSPRHWAEIFNKVTPLSPLGRGAGGEGRSDTQQQKGGNFLQIDSSVFMVYTSDDPELPKSLTLAADGKERFKRYLPMDRSFVNWIENYPYPYVIGNLCWQFPCMTPSDWEAQHLHKANNPKTVEDWKAALDCTVIKQGVFNMVFHPHGWIRNDQMVELIDYAVVKHGKKVKFLTFKEALERLKKNLLNGESIRHDNGNDGGVRLMDLNGDQYVDVAVGNGRTGWTATWDVNRQRWEQQSWKEFIAFSDEGSSDLWKRFGLFGPRKIPTLITIRKGRTSVSSFDGTKWASARAVLPGLPEDLFPAVFLTLRDVDGNGMCELITQCLDKFAVFESPDLGQTWKRLKLQLPIADWAATRVGGGLRFVDLNADGKLDIIFSNEKEYGIYLFTDMEKGWSKKILHGKRSEPRASASGADELPMISRNGTNNGFWVHSGYLWWSNEDTALLKDHVDRRKIADLLKSGVK